MQTTHPVEYGTYKGVRYVLTDLGSGAFALTMGDRTRAYRLTEEQRQKFLATLRAHT